MSSHHHQNGNNKDIPEVHWTTTKKVHPHQTQFTPEEKMRPYRRPQGHNDGGQECIPGVGGVKAVALLATFLGIGVMGCCGWVLHRSIQDWRNPTLVTASNLLSQVNTFFGGTTGLYDLDVIYRILTSCSATGFIGGILQFILSFGLLLATEGKGRGRAYAKFWVICHLFIMCAIGGAFLCIMTNELQISTAIIVFLAVTGSNFLLLLPFSWVVFMYGAYKDPNTFV